MHRSPLPPPPYTIGKRLLQCIATALCERADQCNPQEVSNSVWAYAKLGFYHGGLMGTMAAEATRRIDEFSQQNLANLAWSFAKLAHLDQDLMQAVAGGTGPAGPRGGDGPPFQGVLFLLCAAL